MEETIELRELFDILKKRLKMIIAITTSIMLVGTIYTFLIITPIYQADTTLMVNNTKGMNVGDIAANFDIGAISANQKIVVTYGEIVKSRIVLEQVIDRLKLEMTYEDILGIVSSAPVGNTEILKISVKNPDSAMASKIANTISDVFVKEVMRILKVNNVETIDKAVVPEYPISPKKALNVAISTVLGAMVAVFVAFGLEYLDRTMKTPEDVEKYLGLPVIGTIAEFEIELEEMTDKVGA